MQNEVWRSRRKLRWIHKEKSTTLSATVANGGIDVRGAYEISGTMKRLGRPALLLMISIHHKTQSNDHLN